MIEYDIEIENINDVLIRYRALEGETTTEMHGIMREAAHKALTHMATHVPYHSGTLYRAINISREQNYGFKPGGAGGGGFYEVHVGVDGEQAPHADWVIHGTGLFGPTGEIIRGGTYRRGGNVMVFQKNGEGDVFTRSVLGQQPQTSWFEDAYDVADASIRAQLARLNS